MRFTPAGTSETTKLEAERAGFRFGSKGTHTSRTMMLEELTTVLAATSSTADRNSIADAIIEDNCLAKPTLSTRRLSNQRLGELYGLSPEIPLFRVLRRLWVDDMEGRPLLALLAALARDPLLRASAESVVELPIGVEFNRSATTKAIRAATGESRLSDSTVDKVVRNVASSWAQAGHLIGRTFKTRQRVHATPGAVAYAVYLAWLTGYRGESSMTSPWVTALDCTPTAAQELAFHAKRLGMIDLRVSGDVFALDVRRLDPWREGA